MWDFETDPEYQELLDWADAFVREEVEPLDLIWPHLQFTPLTETRRKVVDPLKEQVRQKGLWATHLGPELGGQGYGQLKLALLNEVIGRSQWAPIIFGCQAPDTGNAEIIAHYGTPEQKERYLRPLLDGELFSSYSMTEPQGGADPTQFTTSAVRDGDDWVINGWKYFSSNANTASFLIVMVVTNPDVSAYQGMSMFLLPTDTPGVNIVRNVGLHGERDDEGSHALIHYDNVRVPDSALLGGEGQAFVIAQTRLGGGRIHHAMRTIGLAQKAIDMMCERVLSRQTAGSLLADKQAVQGYIADSYAQLKQFRLMVLYTAWEIDKYNDYKRGAQGHRRRQGRHADGAARHRLAGNASARRARRHQRDAVPRHGHRRRGDGAGRRPHRGAQDHGRQAGAARLQGQRRRLALGVAAPQARSRRGQVRRVPRTGGGQPVSEPHARHRAPGRMDGRAPRCRARGNR